MDLSSSIGPYITINLHGLFFFFNPLILLLLKNLPKKVKTNMKMSILVTKKHQLNLFCPKYCLYGEMVYPLIKSQLFNTNYNSQNSIILFKNFDHIISLWSFLFSSAITIMITKKKKPKHSMLNLEKFGRLIISYGKKTFLNCQ